MIKIFKFLIFGEWCNHVWETKSQGNIESRYGNYSIGTYYDCKCKKCGCYKTFKLK